MISSKKPQVLQPMIPTRETALAALPRLQGDGIDSELLKQKIIPTNKPIGRHQKLATPSRATTITKTATSKTIPHEPVKGAVNLTPSGHGHHTTSSKEPILITAKPSSVTVSKTGGVSGKTKVSHDYSGSKQRPHKHRTDHKTSKYGESSNRSSGVENTKTVIRNKPDSDIEKQTEQYNGRTKPETNSCTVEMHGVKSKGWAGMIQSGSTSVRSAVEMRKLYGSEGEVECVRTVDIPVYSAPSHLHPDTYRTMQNWAARNNEKAQNKKPTSVKTSSDKELVKADTVESRKTEQVTGTGVVLPEDERQVEGQARTEVEKLNNEVEVLRLQYEEQAKINTDLKKLLVASMGDDLHCKVETLVRTKTQLASEISCYSNKVNKDNENLEQLSIQADMWCSKFRGSSVLLDEMGREKEQITNCAEQSKRALTQLMQERLQLREWLMLTYRYLKLFRNSFDPASAQRPPPTIPNLLELARTNLLMSESVKNQLLASVPMNLVAIDSELKDGLTPAEKLAYQILSENDTDLAMPTTQALRTCPRFHPHARYHNITFNCCRKCKGEIYVV